MSDNFIKISEFGFQLAGRWYLSQGRLEYEVDANLGSRTRVLYAFIADGSLKYVGKTTHPLRHRLQRYKTPPKSARAGASTTIKNHKNLCDSLLAGKKIEIYVFLDPKEDSFQGFRVDLAAALEDSVIHALRPPWNGRTVAGPQPSACTSPPQSSPLKKAVIQPRKDDDRRLSAADFEAALALKLAKAHASGAAHIDVQSGDLHREVGSYPGRSHIMPVCCSVMLKCMKAADAILAAPPKGKGAKLLIRYLLPR